MASPMDKAFVLTNRISLLGVEQIPPRPIFDAVFCVEPTQMNRDPRVMVANVTGVDSARRWSFTVSSQADRIDILQQALLDPGADTAGFKRLRSVEEVLTAFAERVLAKSEILPWATATRIAVGCVASWQVADGAAANRVLSKKFPGLPVQPDDQDVIFRRNQPRPIPGLGVEMRCNRIETWQSARSFTVVVGMAPRIVSNRHVVLVETDCNSEQDRRDPLGADLGPPLLRALVSESVHLVPNEITP